MINGEFYTIPSDGTIFIYRNGLCQQDSMTHYACVFQSGRVCVYNHNATGIIFKCDTRISTEEEKKKLQSALKENGFYWNQANKKMMKID